MLFRSLVLYSEQLDNANWTKTDCIVQSNVAVAPDGSTTADRIIANATANPNVYQGFATPVWGQTYVYSVWLKAELQTEAVLQLYVNSAGICVHTNAAVVYGPGTATISTSSDLVTITGLSSTSWTRVVIQAIPYHSTGSLACYIKTRRSTIAVGDTLLAWGAQVITTNTTIQTLNSPLYIQTTGAALTNVPVSSSGNILQQSENPTTSPWILNNIPSGAFTPVAGIAPDGSTAYLLTDTTLLGDAAYAYQEPFITASATNVYGFSVFVKSYSATYIDIYNFFNPSTRGSYVRYNFNTDALTAYSADGGGLVPWNVTRTFYANGWIRISYNVSDALGTNTILQFRLFPASRDGNILGATYFWGAQVVQVQTPMSLLDYVRTTAAAITYVASTGTTLTVSSLQVSYASVTAFTLSASVSGNSISGASPDAVFVGQQYRPDTRLSGDPLERLTFDVKSVLRDSPTVSDDRRRIPSNPVIDAAKIMGLELVKKTTDTFSYNRYTPVSGDNVYYNAYDWFSDVGRSHRARMAIDADTEVHFFDKHLDETKQIPQNPRFDAMRVMGLEPINKTSSIINLARYTPLRTTDYTYYNKYDWYSMVPRSQRAFFAAGIGDGSPYVYDNMLISADHFVYSGEKHFYDQTILGYGSSSQTSRLAGSIDPETMKFTLKQTMKRGVDTTIVINNRHQSTTDAGFTAETSAFKNKSWFQLTPLYTDYDHIVEAAGATEVVHVGDYYGGVRHSNNGQETMAMLLAQAPKRETITSSDVYGRVYNKRATIGDYNSSTLISVVRTNRILYSERLDRSLWSTTGLSVIQTSVLLSASLPYRNVSYDADQLQELFTNQAYTYAPRKWYTLVPLATRTSFTSTGISLITLSSSNTEHYVQTIVTALSENYFSAGMYVKRRTGVNKVRLYVGPQNNVVYDLTSSSGTYDLMGSPVLPFDIDLMSGGTTTPHWADFDLSSITVTTSVNVNMANIVDRGDGWYLVKILGPIDAQTQSSNFTRILTDTVSALDSISLDSSLFYIAPSDLLTTSGSIDLLYVGTSTNEDLLI